MNGCSTMRLPMSLRTIGPDHGPPEVLRCTGALAETAVSASGSWAVTVRLSPPTVQPGPCRRARCDRHVHRDGNVAGPMAVRRERTGEKVVNAAAQSG